MLELNEGGKEMSACKAKRTEIRVETGMTRKKIYFSRETLIFRNVSKQRGWMWLFVEMAATCGDPPTANSS